jgi:hypothetical protein
VSAETKLELLGLIDQAVVDGWAHARACRVLDLADVRAHRWRQRLREARTLEDRDPGGWAVHGLLAWEEQAILDLIETWGWVDRSHRKLAHRGSYTGAVFVSPSTLLRVALKHRVTLPGEPFRPRPVLPAMPQVPWEKNRIWIWDATHFTRCKAGRLRDRRCRHPLLDRIPALERADLDPSAAAVRPGARERGAARPRRGCRPSVRARIRSSSPGRTTGRR